MTRCTGLSVIHPVSHCHYVIARWRAGRFPVFRPAARPQASETLKLPCKSGATFKRSPSIGAFLFPKIHSAVFQAHLFFLNFRLHALYRHSVLYACNSAVCFKAAQAQAVDRTRVSICLVMERFPVRYGLHPAECRDGSRGCDVFSPAVRVSRKLCLSDKGQR